MTCDKYHFTGFRLIHPACRAKTRVRQLRHSPGCERFCNQGKYLNTVF